LEQWASERVEPSGPATAPQQQKEQMPLRALSAQPALKQLQSLQASPPALLWQELETQRRLRELQAQTAPQRDWQKAAPAQQARPQAEQQVCCPSSLLQLVARPQLAM